MTVRVFAGRWVVDTTCRVQDRADMKKQADGCSIKRATESDYIYTTKMSKQVTKGHVRDAVHMYLVN
jgi:hypothetical protein